MEFQTENFWNANISGEAGFLRQARYVKGQCNPKMKFGGHKTFIPQTTF